MQKPKSAGALEMDRDQSLYSLRDQLAWLTQTQLGTEGEKTQHQYSS